MAAACLTMAWISVSCVSTACRFLRTARRVEVSEGCACAGWWVSGWGGRAGAGWCGAGRARGRSTQPGATRYARTGHGRVGRALSLGLELLLELLDLPREIEGGAARVVGVRASACNGTPARRHMAVGGATGVACRGCVQL